MINPWSWMRARLSPYFLPDELHAQPTPLHAELPYEDFLTDGLERTVVLLSDGGIGLVWELALVEHEFLRNDEIVARCEGVAKVLGCLQERDMVAQLIFEVEPAWEIPARPGKADNAAGEVVAARVQHIESLAAGRALGRSAFRTLRRRLFLTLRADGLQREESVGDLMKRALLGVAESQEERHRVFAEQLQRLLALGLQLEDGMDALGFQPQRCGPDPLLQLLRWPWHDERSRRGDPALRRSYDPDRTVRSQIPRGFVRQHRAGVQVGDDSWEVLSWLEQPRHVPHALFTLLLGVAVPLRCVLTLRPCLNTTDLNLAATQLKVPLLGGARKTRHLSELEHVETRRVHGEELYWASLQLHVKNEQIELDALETRGVGRQLAHQLSQATGIDLVVEQAAAPGLFLLSQPLAYTPGTAWFTGRELRVLTSSLGAYLPVFGGFTGSSDAPRHRVQLMHARGGEPIWLDPRANPTSPHTAVLASTGAGKSFYLANLLTAELAAHPDALIFIIDSLTSYRVLGEVAGETEGFALVQPPRTTPSLWDGALTPERLGVLVGLLRVAIGLVDPDATLKPEHDVLLEGAITKAFEDRALEAGTRFAGADADLFDLETVEGPRALPRLSDVVANLAQVAATKGLPAERAASLQLMLSAFYGEGRYASFFDSSRAAEPEAPTPQVTLYDLGQVEDDTVRALTLSACVAEVVRHVMRPENRGRPGVLLVDEAGVLLSQPGEAGQALVDFVTRAWKTFRKLGVCCIGSTNEPADYIEKAGPRAIWANSANKVLLRLKSDDLRLARTGDPSRGLPALFDDELVGQIVGSLRKVDGVYSQGVWWAEERVGSFTYVPSGHDYWLAASKPLEVESFLLAADRLGSRRTALHWLARTHPAGVRDEDGQIRPLTEEEVQP